MANEAEEQATRIKGGHSDQKIKIHHSVPVPGLTHVKATAIKVTFASKRVQSLRLTFRLLAH